MGLVYIRGGGSAAISRSWSLVLELQQRSPGVVCVGLDHVHLPCVPHPLGAPTSGSAPVARPPHLLLPSTTSSACTGTSPSLSPAGKRSCTEGDATTFSWAQLLLQPTLASLCPPPSLPHLLLFLSLLSHRTTLYRLLFSFFFAVDFILLFSFLSPSSFSFSLKFSFAPLCRHSVPICLHAKYLGAVVVVIPHL